ncbi:hypothetical protein [Anatilimnocola floriformis]|uniref:hypothetical protein n=1 Tax=Anatilimnocola floriformis TaxID=2948575 RepID=UPI0020C4A37F|nr:hypothetical protein [Anatilimnocola floriformis]
MGLSRVSRRQVLAGASGLAGLSLLSGHRLLSQEQAKPEEKPAEEVKSFNEFTPQSEKAVRRGEEFLMKTMHRDGGCGVDVGQPQDIGCSAMVGLALMAQGNTPVEGPRSREVQRLVSYILRAAEVMPNDDITSQNGTQLQNKIGRHAHSFFAALFLAEVIGEGWDTEPVRDGLKKIITAIIGTQTPEGHWGNQSWAPTLGTVMGWVALRASHYAGMKVGSSPELTAKHLVQQMSTSLNQNQGSWMHTLYKNATGIRVLYALGMENEDVAKKAFKDVEQLVNKDNTAFSQAGGEEYLAFHLITETMLQKGGKDWATWFPTIREKILAVQNADGSWTGHHCITSRTFCTAAAILVLTSPNRYLPISQA